MADSIDRDWKDRVRGPVAFSLTVMWLVAGLAALLIRDVQVFVIATAPFGVMVGALFGQGIIRRANGDDL